MKTKTDLFMESFMADLNNNRFKKDNQPNNGSEIDEVFIEQQRNSYADLLELSIFKVETNNYV